MTELDVGRKERPAGIKRLRSNFASEPSFLLVGHVARAHGVRGEVWVKINPGREGHLLQSPQEVFIGDKHKVCGLQSIRKHRNGMLLMVDCCSDRNEAESLRGQKIWVAGDSSDELGINEYYVEDLVGMQVNDEDGENVGKLVEVLPTGANDVYRVVGSGAELLLPAIDSVIRSVHVSKDEMVVRLIPGIRG